MLPVRYQAFNPREWLKRFTVVCFRIEAVWDGGSEGISLLFSILLLHGPSKQMNETEHVCVTCVLLLDYISDTPVLHSPVGNLALKILVREHTGLVWAWDVILGVAAERTDTELASSGSTCLSLHWLALSLQGQQTAGAGAWVES